jgi:hypothetical protein
MASPQPYHDSAGANIQYRALSKEGNSANPLQLSAVSTLAPSEHSLLPSLSVLAAERAAGQLRAGDRSTLFVYPTRLESFLGR